MNHEWINESIPSNLDLIRLISELNRIHQFIEWINFLKSKPIQFVLNQIE